MMHHSVGCAGAFLEMEKNLYYFGHRAGQRGLYIERA